jgi:hypothetical protein
MQGLQVRPSVDVLGPIEPPVLPDRGSTEPSIDSGGEEMGPMLEEYGPSANLIRIGTVEPTIAHREPTVVIGGE